MCVLSPVFWTSPEKCPRQKGCFLGSKMGSSQKSGEIIGAKPAISRARIIFRTHFLADSLQGDMVVRVFLCLKLIEFCGLAVWTSINIAARTLLAAPARTSTWQSFSYIQIRYIEELAHSGHGPKYWTLKPFVALSRRLIFGKTLLPSLATIKKQPLESLHPLIRAGPAKKNSLFFWKSTKHKTN